MFRSLIALWEKLFLSLEVWALKLMYLLLDGRREKLEWPVCPSFLAIVTVFLMQHMVKMGWMERIAEPVMDWAVFNTLCRFRQSGAGQLPREAEVHPVRTLSTA